jgi:tetratricopeptide (TPR) repeat protein
MRKDVRPILFSLVLLFVAFVEVGLCNKETARPRRKADFVFPSTDIQHFTFGFNEVIADLYWLRAIQDFDVCVYPKAPKNAPRTGLNRTHHCEMDWGYRMLEVITTLAPRNYVTYNSGGVMLSVVLDDIKGATEIYNKGLQMFPNDWQLNFQGATHYLTEVGDLQKAAYHYNRAVQNGAPVWAAALSARLFDEIGRTELAIANLKAQLKRNSDDKFIDAVRRKLYELEDKLAHETVKQREQRNSGGKGSK